MPKCTNSTTQYQCQVDATPAHRTDTLQAFATQSSFALEKKIIFLSKVFVTMKRIRLVIFERLHDNQLLRLPNSHLQCHWLDPSDHIAEGHACFHRNGILKSITFIHMPRIQRCITRPFKCRSRVYLMPASVVLILLPGCVFRTSMEFDHSNYRWKQHLYLHLCYVSRK